MIFLLCLMHALGMYFAGCYWVTREQMRGRPRTCFLLALVWPPFIAYVMLREVVKFPVGLYREWYALDAPPEHHPRDKGTAYRG